MSAALSAHAREILRAYGFTPMQWAIANGQPDGKWYGDACGCNDDRCAGYHHDESDECGCIYALLQYHPRPRP